MSKYTFNRYEVKYLITKEQQQKILSVIERYLDPDKYPHTIIQSLYLDTDTYLLIRRSIEKPTYKEKIRLRSYGVVKEDDKIFLELKKKSEKIVFKRRIKITQKECFSGLNTNFINADSQIGKEINYFINFYGKLKPAMLLIYERDAFIDNNSDLRITFDSNVKYRNYDLSLDKGLYGTPLINENQLLMEVKSSINFPLWLVRMLSQERIYKTSFSKYGTAYKILQLEKEKQEEYVV